MRLGTMQNNRHCRHSAKYLESLSSSKALARLARLAMLLMLASWCLVVDFAIASEIGDVSCL